ncbi:MAG: FMN-binding protein [Gammaproteobacteria bacterium]
MTLLVQSMRWLLLLLFLSTANPCQAKIYYSKNEAMELAFGKNPHVEMLSLFPNESQTSAIEKLARVKMESSLFTFYVGKKDGKVQGYAAIETRTVRTKPETLLVVLTPEGALRNVYTLAFHEPPEYQPPERWYEQMYKRPIEQLDFNAGIQGISGATLSTRSALNSTRKVMAVYQIMLKEGQN